MHLVQVLLPIVKSPEAGELEAEFSRLRDELTETFGGMTFYRNAPAEGLWSSKGDVEEDRIVVAEVMADHLDRDWWSNYRKQLETRFHQEVIVIRAIEITRF